MNYKKAYGVLKTYEDMEYDYDLAQYPFNRNLYNYFVRLNQSNKPAPNKPIAASKQVDMYGRIKPTEEIAALGKTLRELFDSNRYR